MIKNMMIKRKGIVIKERKIKNMKVKEKKNIWMLLKRKEIIKGVKSKEMINIEIIQIIIEKRVEIRIF